jgi:putative ABC transport system permease protein
MRPPRLATWLLMRGLPAGPEGDTIRGDLAEEYFARAGRSRLGAAVWYWRAALSIRVRYRPRRTGISASRQATHAAVVQDLRYAIRTLAKSRSYTAVVLITLALGIGANTAIFSALDAVLLEPLPYPHADRIVSLVGYNPSKGIDGSNVSAADFVDWERDATSFEAMSAFYVFSTAVRGATSSAPAERIGSVRAHRLFEVLGVAPALGRPFAASDAHPDSTSAAIISHGFWQRHFGGTADIIGRPLRPGAPTAVIGVMPQGFAFPDEVELWVPAYLDTAADPRSNRYYEAMGRLRPGVTLAQAQAELDAISARLEAAYPSTNQGSRVRAVPLVNYIVGDARRTMWLLIGAVGLVMLVACANVANLSLAQAGARQREIAVRAAIGAGRSRILRQVLTESVLLSLVAGAFGIVVGRWGLQLLITIAGSGIPRLEHATLNQRVLLFSLAVSLATGILFGLLPALHLSRADLVRVLKEGSRGSGTRSGLRQSLVVAEVALALVLLTAAGLLARSFQGLRTADVGFQPTNLLTMRVTLTGPRYQEQGPEVPYFADAIRGISAIPGVRSAAAVLSLPVGGGGFYLGRGFIRPGREQPPQEIDAGFQIVTPGYFKTLGIPLLQGRDFNEHDTAGSPPVAVINSALARRIFRGENPLGQKILVWRDEKTPREIVGVVGDLKPRDLTEDAGIQIYAPNTQSWSNDMTLVVRTEGQPSSAAAAVKAVLQRVDPSQPAYDVKTFDTILFDALAQQRFSTLLFASFAVLALTLAAVGLYGVMTHLVNGRAHEMGVRMALGARPADVRGLVVRQGLKLLAIGTLIGVPSALAAVRLLGKLIYGVRPGDPATLTAVAVIIGSVAWAAAYIPARRATRVDPATILRGD